MKGGKWQRAVVKEAFHWWSFCRTRPSQEGTGGGNEYRQREKSGYTAHARLKRRAGKNILVSIAAILKFDQQQGSQLCRGTRMGIERILHFMKKRNVVACEYSLPRSRFCLVLKSIVSFRSLPLGTFRGPFPSGKGLRKDGCICSLEMLRQY